MAQGINNPLLLIGVGLFGGFLVGKLVDCTGGEKAQQDISKHQTVPRPDNKQNNEFENRRNGKEGEPEATLLFSRDGKKPPPQAQPEGQPLVVFYEGALSPTASSRAAGIGCSNEAETDRCTWKANIMVAVPKECEACFTKDGSCSEGCLEGLIRLSGPSDH